MRIVSQLFMILLTLNTCNQIGDGSNDAYLKEIKRWQEKRLERLKSENGWLNLAGLFWLEEGVNTIGSDSSNSIIYPDKAPSHLGKYILSNSKISFIAEPGVEVLLKGKPIEEIEIQTGKNGKTILLQTGSLAWFIIERGGKFGIRLRDPGIARADRPDREAGLGRDLVRAFPGTEPAHGKPATGGPA